MLLTRQPLHERPVEPSYRYANGPNYHQHPPAHLDGPASFLYSAGIPMVVEPKIGAPVAVGTWNERHLPGSLCAELTTAWIRTFCD